MSETQETPMKPAADRPKTVPFPVPRGRRWDHLDLLERIDASGSIST